MSNYLPSAPAVLRAVNCGLCSGYINYLGAAAASSPQWPALITAPVVAGVKLGTDALLNVAYQKASPRFRPHIERAKKVTDVVITGGAICILGAAGLISAPVMLGGLAYLAASKSIELISDKITDPNKKQFFNLTAKLSLVALTAIGMIALGATGPVGAALMVVGGITLVVASEYLSQDPRLFQRV